MNASSFALARSCTTHLVVQPSDLRLNPPESYLFVQDGLIIACGLLYSLCYIFYAIRTYSDRRCAGPIVCMYVCPQRIKQKSLIKSVDAEICPMNSSTPGQRRLQYLRGQAFWFGLAWMLSLLLPLFYLLTHLVEDLE